MILCSDVKKKHVLMEPGVMYRGGQIVFLSKMGT